MRDEFLANVRLGYVDVGNPGDARLGTAFWRGIGSCGCKDGFRGWFGRIELSERGAEAPGSPDDENVVAHIVDQLAKDLFKVFSRTNSPRREGSYKPTSGILSCLTQPRTRMTSSGYAPITS